MKRFLSRGEQLPTQNLTHDEAKVSYGLQMSSAKVRASHALDTPSTHLHAAQSDRDDVLFVEDSELSCASIVQSTYMEWIPIVSRQ